VNAARLTPRLAALIAAVCALGLATASAAGAQTRASLPDIEDEVMCPICGTLLAHSEAPQAERERALIRNLIARGQDKEQIKDALVAEYGQRVLATPGTGGFDLLAWLVPGLAILLAAGAIAFALAKVRRSSARERKPPPELDPADAARLSEDLSSYDR
jgi:cytochrome c-type biogenesis protein CcmH